MLAQIVLFDGFDLLDVLAPYEVLYGGGMASGGALRAELVSAEGPREVVSGVGGVTLRATAALDPARADLVVVPGAAGRVGEPGEVPDHDAGAGEWRADEFIPVLLGRTLNTELPGLLKAAMDRPEVTVATVCGGSLVLAMAGLLEGRYATTHHMGLDMLDATGVNAVRARVVDDGDLVTGAGVTSGLDLGLYLLERELGPRIAHAVEELFAYERRGTPWRHHGPAPVAL
ncbi:DJ-1/PfpI family protein [Streptomyces rapamycinicus]|uniref:Glutamine amidotransferase n=2 Tax=Streptomyces rapamycinicus TaxID=1226757 RepID=A0A0A0N8Y9_STRRN|nr:DJ-1/PfpI family protein [Streptomyces rapamycinicus]AGP52528.1 glutamine amidotransferase [Streptomyces rapamycinicus NRRL 5491]MBB4779997.1 transcriptional regulator GlxA family with amidase domain [Streptomyces rapamycinicus]RLV75348.1 glutamine amidotransferase [Streptomyces rapamycinicus NRRL 5491]UTP28704.1 DJ-1/PfpI family protein [Streptomyces rapamycinicus NRRL 5491]